MTIEIVGFDDDRLEAGASLVAARYGTELVQKPLLSRRYQHAAETIPFLHDLRNEGPGVAALEDGRLSGFILGMVSMFKGVYTAYVPDFGHGTDTLNSRNVYRDMYAQLAACWGWKRMLHSQHIHHGPPPPGHRRISLYGFRHD